MKNANKIVKLCPLHNVKPKIISIGLFLSIFHLLEISTLEKSKYPIININETKNIDPRKMKVLLEYLLNNTIRGFLNFISVCEGTARKTKQENEIRPNIQEYKICFTNKICSDLRKHPAKIYEANGTDGSILRSSASGRYQFLKKTWDALYDLFPSKILLKNYKEYAINYFNNINSIYYDAEKIYKNINDLVKYKFGPFWQDLGAIILFDRAGAINDILEENYEEAIYKLAPIWASLPSFPDGNSYYKGQPAFSLDRAKELCEKKIESTNELLKIKIQ